MPHPAPGLLRARDLSKAYGRRVALLDVSLDVRAGDVTGLIGPNGAGKTTLLSGLAGTLPLDRGAVSWQGHVVPAAARRTCIGYMPDGVRPWPSESVQWVLQYICEGFGGRRDDRDALVDALQLTPILAQPLGALSKGQLKRTLLAAALLLPQPVVLLDEPFDGLDLRQTRSVADLFRAQARHGRALLLSIHQISDAARVCDRLVLLQAGRVVGAGTPDELSAQAGCSHEPVDMEEVFLALT